MHEEEIVTEEPMTGAELLTESPQDRAVVEGGDVGGVEGGDVFGCQVTATLAGALVLLEVLATIE